MKAITKLLIITGAGLASCILLALVFVRPTLSNITELNGQLRTKLIELKTLDQQILAYNTAQSDLSKVTERDRILNAIVTSENLVQAVQDIESAAERSETAHTLTIDDSLSQGSKTKAVEIVKGKVGVVEVAYQLGVKNDYEGMIRFLKYLEHMPHFTELKSIRLVAETATGPGNTTVHSGNVNSSVDGVFFVQKDSTKTQEDAESLKTQTDED